MHTTHTKTRRHGGKIGMIALAAAGVAAAAAGTYFFLSPQQAKRRAAMKSWMVKAKGDVLERIEGLRKIDAQTYLDIVDDVVAKYKKTNKASPKELTALAKELKGHWQTIAKQAKGSGPKKSSSK